MFQDEVEDVRSGLCRSRFLDFDFVLLFSFLDDVFSFITYCFTFM
jgi:hypothetical protein